MGIFINKEKLAAANATYKKRMAEINAKSALVEAEIIVKREQNRLTFKERIAKATAERNEKIAESKRTGKVVL
jgi:hypothetical protein